MREREGGVRGPLFPFLSGVQHHQSTTANADAAVLHANHTLVTLLLGPVLQLEAAKKNDKFTLRGEAAGGRLISKISHITSAREELLAAIRQDLWSLQTLYSRLWLDFDRASRIPPRMSPHACHVI